MFVYIVYILFVHIKSHRARMNNMNLFPNRISASVKKGHSNAELSWIERPFLPHSWFSGNENLQEQLPYSLLRVILPTVGYKAQLY